MTDRFLTGPDIDQILAQKNASGDVQWLLADQQGTIRDVAEYDSGTETTSVVNHLQYDSFGRITDQTAPGEQPLLAYTGLMWDADAELQYSRARWYDPTVGRFLSEDPLSFVAGDMNLTRYVSNAPTNYVDPSGLQQTTTLASPAVGQAQIDGMIAAYYGVTPGPGQNVISTPRQSTLFGAISGYWSDATMMASHPLSTTGGFVVGVGTTFASGAAYDSFQGCSVSMQYRTLGWTTLFSSPADVTPHFGNQDAYNTGVGIGSGAGNIINTVLLLHSLYNLPQTLSSIRNIVTSVDWMDFQWVGRASQFAFAGDAVAVAAPITISLPVAVHINVAAVGATALAGQGFLGAGSNLSTAFSVNAGDPRAIQPGEITTYGDADSRRVVGDHLEPHELWQHANLRANGLTTTRLSTPASQNNPVIVLPRPIHQQVNAAQRALNPGAQTPLQNISANAQILRDLSAAPNDVIRRLVEEAIRHARSYGFF